MQRHSSELVFSGCVIQCETLFRVRTEFNCGTDSTAPHGKFDVQHIECLLVAQQKRRWSGRAGKPT